MRVTNASLYRNYTASMNDVQVRLNKSMNKISSGAAYEKAADSPLNYYSGKMLDNQYQDTLSKSSLLKDVQNRLYQQELGARDINSLLQKAKTQVQYARTATSTGTSDLKTFRDDLNQKVNAMVNDLNMQYENFYIYGGNDVKVSPFSLDVNLNDPANQDIILTYRHTFPGEADFTEFTFTFKEDANGEYGFTINNASRNGTALSEQETIDKLVTAMSEKGRLDIGYGSINEKNVNGDRDTLLDTFTGGLNLLTGLNSDAVIQAKNNGADMKDYLLNGLNGTQEGYGLNDSPIALVGKAVLALNKYIEGDDKDKATLVADLGTVIDDMTVTEHTLTTVYSDLGNKYALLDDTQDRLNTIADSLQSQYKDKLGADPYEAILEMFNNQYSYNAALQVGSKLLSSSLFDFMG